MSSWSNQHCSGMTEIKGHQLCVCCSPIENDKIIHNTGKVVIIDRRFCVTVGILAMHDVGVFGQALIKKRARFWPKPIPSNHVEEFMKDHLLNARTVKQQQWKDFF
ncbi:hypothetical protein ACHAXS_000963, partial [Conticribra weissflogii]